MLFEVEMITKYLSLIENKIKLASKEDFNCAGA